MDTGTLVFTIVLTVIGIVVGAYADLDEILLFTTIVVGVAMGAVVTATFAKTKAAVHIMESALMVTLGCVCCILFGWISWLILGYGGAS